MYRVLRFTTAAAEKVSVLLQDDVVSRQSVTARDAKSLGLSGNDRYVLVEGSEAALARAVELTKGIAEPLSGTDADRIYRRFRSQDDEAASGMGLIFGP
ncbi:MAG TPA: hypothetical protein VFA17_11180 [Thermoplasmata archaeon]|nr:hypothetical protein [Thermoplasmata archaeon]